MHYIATVKMIVEADDEAEACDAISEALRGAAFDWMYLTPETPISRFIPDTLTGQGQYTKPTPVEVGSDYEEGDVGDPGRDRRRAWLH